MDVEKAQEASKGSIPDLTEKPIKQELDDGSPTPLDSKKESFLVELDPDEDPRKFTNVRKWSIVLVLCFGALISTCSTSMVSGTLHLSMVPDIHISLVRLRLRKEGSLESSMSAKRLRSWVSVCLLAG